MQPILKPIEKKYQDYLNKRREEEKKTLEEMMKQPYSYENAIANLKKLK